jgi:hypothetical protein
MVYSCMSATFKIYSISTEINNEELSSFSSKYFGSENRLTVVELIKYLSATIPGTLSNLLKSSIFLTLSRRTKDKWAMSRSPMKKLYNNFQLGE